MINPYANVWTESIRDDQAGFLAGYVAAAVTKTGKVGTYGGFNFPAGRRFYEWLCSTEWQYYNDKNDASVQVIGWDVAKQDGIFIDSFDDLAVGRTVTQQLLDQGVDIILPVAGPIGLGTAEVLVQRGEGLLIGVDTDWAVTFPEHAGVILTSVEKRIDNSVINAVRHDGGWEFHRRDARWHPG